MHSLSGWFSYISLRVYFRSESLSEICTSLSYFVVDHFYYWYFSYLSYVYGLVNWLCGSCYRFCQLGPKENKSNSKKNSFTNKCNLPLSSSLHFLYTPFLYVRMYLRT